MLINPYRTFFFGVPESSEQRIDFNLISCHCYCCRSGARLTKIYLNFHQIMNSNFRLDICTARRSSIHFIRSNDILLKLFNESEIISWSMNGPRLQSTKHAIFAFFFV